MARNKASARLLNACVFDYDMFRLIQEKPHLVGWMVGKTKLTDIHSDWIKYIWTSKKSVSLMAHRGSYKSTAIAQIGPLWYLLFNPEARIAIVRKTFTDAADTVATIAKFFEVPEIREMFRYAHGEYPEFRTRKEGILSMSFKKLATPEGSINGFGLSSAFVGRHFDIIICDDISTLDDRLFKSKREYTKMIWMELSTNIIDRGKPCNYIGTPWHKDGVESIIPAPLTFSIDECNLMSEEEIEFARSQTTASLFAANYLLKFMSDDDSPFKDPIMGEWKTSGIEGVYAHVDAAYGGSDYTALTIMARRNDGKLQVYGRLYKESIVDCLDWIVETCERMKVRKIFCEKQSDRGWTGSMLRKKGMMVAEYDENTKKDHKIVTYIGEVWPLLVFGEDTDPQYLSQLEDWCPETKNHDDAADGLSCLIRAKFSKKGTSIERWRM